MQIEYVARDFPLDDTVREYSNDKLGKLVKYLEEPIAAHVVLEVEKYRHRAEVHVSHRHGRLQAAEETDEMRGAIHLVADKLEKQARRSLGRFRSLRRRAARHEQSETWSMRVLESGSRPENTPPRVIAADRVRVKPMTLEEAVLQLDGSGSEFLVFREPRDQLISVLYRRKDGDFGLISPES